MIGQHIGYRYDVNLLPDYNRITPFLKKYIEHMGWDDLNWLKMFIWVTKMVSPQFLIEISTAGLQPHQI